MEHFEKEALQKGYTGQNILENPGSLYNLLDKEALNKIYVSTASNIRDILEFSNDSILPNSATTQFCQIQ